MEEELTEVLLPLNNKYVKEFLVFPVEKQLQILKLGILTYKFSEQRFKTVIDNEKEDIIEKLTSQHSKEIEEVKLVNSSLKTKIVNLETKNKDQYNLALGVQQLIHLLNRSFLYIDLEPNYCFLHCTQN